MVTVFTPVLVAVGGAMGAVFRWWGDHLIESMGGPFLLAVLVVNLLGCLLLGFLFTQLDQRFPKISDIDLPLDDVLLSRVSRRRARCEALGARGHPGYRFFPRRR